ncbi:MAG: hypothetical protein ABSH12_01995 [Endomicrobiales bacterium]|jgi:hypothetical protein
MKYIIVLSAFFLASIAAFASEPEIQFSVDRSSITIGDLVRCDVAVTVPPSVTLEQPEKTTEIGQWTVKDLTVAADPRTPQVTHIIYTLTTYSTGQVVIPEIAVEYAPGPVEGKKQKAHGVVKTPAVPVTVASMLEKYGVTGDIHDIKPPLTVRLPFSAYLPWILLVLGILVGVYVWYRRYQKRLAAQFPVPEEPRVPPYQLALERLAKLKQSTLVTEGKIQEFYVVLSDIIRDYLSGLYDIETRDMTTGEIYAQLRAKETDKKKLGTIKSFFDACDLVKFAKYRPDESAAWQDFEQAENIVHT